MSIAELESVGVAEEFDLDSNEALFELVDGVRVEKKMGAHQTDLATALSALLWIHAQSQKLGKVVTETLFVIDQDRGMIRRPDVAFVSAARWPVNKSAPDHAVWNILPDLAVEVVSPTDKAVDALAKVRDYFQAGVRAVWVIYPTLKVIHIFESFTSIRVLTKNEVLDGGAIVPGFTLELKELFGEDENETAETSKQ